MIIILLCGIWIWLMFIHYHLVTNHKELKRSVLMIALKDKNSLAHALDNLLGAIMSCSTKQELHVAVKEAEKILGEKGSDR